MGLFELDLLKNLVLEEIKDTIITEAKDTLKQVASQYITNLPNMKILNMQSNTNLNKTALTPSSEGNGIKIKKEYKQSCPNMTEDEEKKAIMKAKNDLSSILEEKKKELKKWDKDTQNNFKIAFGSTSDTAKQTIMTRIDKMQTLLKSYTIDNFKPADPIKHDIENIDQTCAYVYPDDDQTIYIGPAFCSAPATGQDSKAGVLAHEMSHFESVGSTSDFPKIDLDGDGEADGGVYGIVNSQRFAREYPDKAIIHADSWEYFIEGVK